VIAHEIPQEVGDFAVLLEGGFSRSRAFLFNLLSSAATFPGALVTYFFLPAAGTAVPYLLTLSAASFIYVALADLIPGRRARPGRARSLLHDVLFIATGAATVASLHALL
jgi:zinc and cadmium transporter